MPQMMANAANDGAAENVVCVGDIQHPVIRVVVNVVFICGIHMDGDGFVSNLYVPLIAYVRCEVI